MMVLSALTATFSFLLALVVVMVTVITVTDPCHGMKLPSTPSRATATAAGNSMWQTLANNNNNNKDPAESWKTVFGEFGERGEYMDGYTEQSMAERCRDDYGWQILQDDLDDDHLIGTRRATMMAHLYDSNNNINSELWEYVSMVAFAEHYVLHNDNDIDDTSNPFDTFQNQKQARARMREDGRDDNKPIFAGVVWSDWHLLEAAVAHNDNNSSIFEHKLADFENKGIDYVRMECNFGTADEIGGDIANDSRFQGLAQAAKCCQDREMVPLLLLQVPWRDDDDTAIQYFEQAMDSLAVAFTHAGVESERVILETRPPIGVSWSTERAMSGTDRIRLGVATGKKMFEVIAAAFGDDNNNNNKIAGFCIAGGSTKGDVPTAMEDDTQNAVRQGMRQCARQQWGYDLCFWEMGAKLMLQPKVGRLWGRNTQAGRDAARELFCLNAQDLADEIKVLLPPP